MATTVEHITKGTFDSTCILLPPLPDQRAIASVLDAIDDALERTGAVIAASECLRDALLHDLLTRGITTAGIRLSDDGTVPGIGMIPAANEVVRLGDQCERITKGTMPTTLWPQVCTRRV